MSSTPQRFRFEGKVYRFDPAEMTGRLERELWQATKLTMLQAFEALTGGASFGLAAVLWMSRRQAGEQVTYDEVESWLDGLDKSTVEFELVGEEADESPQLSGANSEN